VGLDGRHRLTSLSTLFKFYRGGHAVLLVEETGITGSPEKTTDLSQVTTLKKKS